MLLQRHMVVVYVTRTRTSLMIGTYISYHHFPTKTRQCTDHTALRDANYAICKVKNVLVLGKVQQANVHNMYKKTTLVAASTIVRLAAVSCKLESTPAFKIAFQNSFTKNENNLKSLDWTKIQESFRRHVVAIT